MTISSEPRLLETSAGTISCWSANLGGDDLRPVLLVHPINLCGAGWLDVASHLAPARTALMPDLRGHGGSTTDGPFGLRAWVGDCIATLDAFGIERAHVVGGSLGGTIAVEMAARHPARVDSVVAIGSTLKPDIDDLSVVFKLLDTYGVRGTFERTVPQIATAPGAPTSVVERIVALSNPNGVDVVSSIWQSAITTDARSSAPMVKCPVLVASGEHDSTCPPSQGARMATALGTEVRVIPGVGHLPMIEAPETTANLINEFLVSVERT